MAYEKQDNQECEESYKKQQLKHNDQISAVPHNREKIRKRKIQEVQGSEFENLSKCIKSSHSDKMIQYKMNKSHITKSTKSNFTRNRVLNWLKSVQYANTQIKQINNGPICEVGLSHKKDILSSNNRDSAADKANEAMSISSDSSEDKNIYSKNDNDKYTKKSRKMGMGKDDVIHLSLNKEGHEENEFRKKDHFVKSFNTNLKQVQCNKYQLQKAKNSQYLKGEDHKSKKRKLPKLTLLSDKSMKGRNDFPSDIRNADMKIQDEISATDKFLSFDTIYDRNNKSNFSRKDAHSQVFSAHLQQKSHLFNTDGPSYENNLILEKKENKYIRYNNEENVPGRASDDESDKTENFEKTENTNKCDFPIDVIGLKKIQNKEISDLHNASTSKNNMNNCVLNLSGDEIGDEHNSGDKDSDITKHFDDNESEVTCNFEIKSDETCDFQIKSDVKTNTSNNCDKSLSNIDDQINSSTCSISGSERTHSFKDERNDNTNSILSNDISINQYCMDDKSEKSHTLIYSNSEISHKFVDNKNKELSNNVIKAGLQFDQNYDRENQQKDRFASTLINIDSEKYKQIKIRKNEIKMSLRLSNLFTFYSNIETPFDNKILISSDDEIEETSIIYEKFRPRNKLNHNLENYAISDGESEKTRSFNKSDKDQSFRESERTRSLNRSAKDQNSHITNTKSTDKNDDNIEKHIYNSNDDILNDENDCIPILSDGESEISHEFKHNNSESTKDFDDNESVETHNFEDARGERVDFLNKVKKTLTCVDDKNYDMGTTFDNASEGTHSFKGEYDGNVDTIPTNKNVLKLNYKDNESEKSHILIDSESENTGSFNKSEKNQSFNESERTRSFNESENEQNSLLTNTKFTDKDNDNIEKHMNNSNNILNNDDDCILILSDCESDGDNNSESTKDFNNKESVETHNFEDKRGEQVDFLNNVNKTLPCADDKNYDIGIPFDNESEGTCSFEGVYDGNVDTISTNEKVLKHNCKDNESEKSHILIDSESENTGSFNKSEKNLSFNESERTQSFNESGDDQNSLLINTKPTGKDNDNIGKHINNSNNILNNDNDCILILSDCESDGDNNSESTKDFNDKESVETHNFEDTRGERVDFLNNVKNLMCVDNKNDDIGTPVDNESEGTCSFKGEYDGNVDTIPTSEKVLNHNPTDNESEKSHILIDSDSDTTSNFEDQKAPFIDHQSKSTQEFEKNKHNEGHMHRDDDETDHLAELNKNRNDIADSLDLDNYSTGSFNGSEANNKNKFGKRDMNIYQDEISTDSFQSSSDIEIL